MRVKKVKRIIAILLVTTMLFINIGVLTAARFKWDSNGYCDSSGGWAETTIYGNETTFVTAYVEATLYVVNKYTGQSGEYSYDTDDDSGETMAAATAWLNISDTAKYSALYIFSSHSVYGRGPNEFRESGSENRITYATH